MALLLKLWYWYRNSTISFNSIHKYVSYKSIDDGFHKSNAKVELGIQVHGKQWNSIWDFISIT